MAKFDLGISDEYTTYAFVNRVEVVDSEGRSFSRRYPTHGVTVALQDDGRTLKVFLPAIEQ